MDIGILGPLTVQCAGGPAVPSAPKPRQLLALLAARAGQVVPVDLLVDELWESNPPSSALTAVQTYIVQLRQLLARTLKTSTDEVARDVLPFAGWGYCLAVEPGKADTHEFSHCARLGRRALLNGENERASVLLRRALRVWRGPALADVRIGPHLLAHRTSLEESRLSVIEQRLEADLRLGRHIELIGELSGLVARYPLHENLCSLFIISLYRAGRPAQALDAFESLRTALREELGMDPSSRVRHLKEAILDADPSMTSGRYTDGPRIELDPPPPGRCSPRPVAGSVLRTRTG
ncbi:AfsR/SARP family transcriptional regulator [Streptomyces sp. ISL-98]|uniref:AfsR/SARP family transcriptional regulator n=1 Tax=Streptomyces sp. ISL-98 TaxID=2819192 RepID=UPI001BEA82FF|nr:AfsR/SARP family transcriptional regulator [Streptomyces sp. ISL-98]MBT2510551.1 AfsR/SARP family transcriptional regulator [Streptomyces sp. ISL-98]